MKFAEKNQARQLRSKGKSVKEIAQELGVARSSVSHWVRNIELTPDQKEELSLRGVKKELIETRRGTRLANENIRRQIIIDQAKRRIIDLSPKELLLIGVVLYWAEGGKTGGVVRFSNGDPRLIKIMMKFFRENCGVANLKFRGYIHIHPHLDARAAENYWSEISEIPLNQFYKTYNKINKSSQNKRDSLPYGTFDIYICSAELLLKIKGWAEKIYELALN